MSEAHTVHSHLEDVAPLAAGLADRAEEGRVILYGPTNYEAGETIPFAILLVDGSPVIEGHGVVAASGGGGEDRDPGFRYRLVLTRPDVLADSDKAQVVRMRADWTRRDDEITAALARLGRNGVPVYALLRPGQEPLLLPEILTAGLVRSALSGL